MFYDLLQSGFGMKFSFDVRSLGALHQQSIALRKLQIDLGRTALSASGLSATSTNMQERMTLASRQTAILQSEIMIATEEFEMAQNRLEMVGRALTTISGLFGLIAYGIARGVKTAIGAFIELDSALVGLKIRSGLSNEELDHLYHQFLKLAEVMPGTASDMARVAEELAKSGVESKNLVEYTREALTLAFSSGMEVDTAATTLVTTMQVFHDSLEGLGDRALPAFNSALIEMDNASTATAAQLANITRRAGAAAAQFGLSSHEMLGLAAATKASGVQTEVAGTSLLNFFTNLMSRTEDAKKVFGDGFAAMAPIQKLRHALNVFNETVKETPGLAYQMFKPFGGAGGKWKMTLNALASAQTRFTDTVDESGKRLNVLDYYLRRAADAFADGTVAQDMMDKRLQSLSARMEQLGDRFKSVLTLIGQDAGVMLLPLIHLGNRALDVFMAMPPALRQIAVAATIATATILALTAALIGLAALYMKVSSDNFLLLTQAGEIAVQPFQTTLHHTKGALGFFAGKGTQAVTGFAGALRRIPIAGNMFELLFQAQGKMLSIFPATGKAIMGFANTLGNVGGKANWFGRALLAVQSGFGALLPLTGPVGIALGLAFGALMIFGAPDSVLTGIKDTMTALGALFSFLIDGTLSFESANLLDRLGMTDMLGPIMGMRNDLGKFATDVAVLWESLGVSDDVAKSWGLLWDSLKTMAQPFIDIGKVLWEVFFGIGDSAKGSTGGLATMLMGVLKMLSSLLVVFVGVVRIVAGSVSGLVRMFMALVGWIVDMIAGFSQMLKGIFTPGSGAFTAGIRRMFGSFFVALSNLIAGVFNYFTGGLWGDKVQGVVEKIRKSAYGLPTSVTPENPYGDSAQNARDRYTPTLQFVPAQNALTPEQAQKLVEFVAKSGGVSAALDAADRSKDTALRNLLTEAGGKAQLRETVDQQQKIAIEFTVDGQNLAKAMVTTTHRQAAAAGHVQPTAVGSRGTPRPASGGRLN